MREEAPIPIERHDDRGAPLTPGKTPNSEPSLGDLFRQLSADTAELVKQEATLAKAELATSATALMHDAMTVGVAVGLALAGWLALTAFAVVGLGTLFGNYWLSSLIVGAVLFVVGGVMAQTAIADAKHRRMIPSQTMATLRGDASWTAKQAHDLKRNLTATSTDTAATQNERR